MEQEQFKREVLPLRGQLYGYALRLLRSEEDVEDVVQEVFLKLWFMRADLARYQSIPALSMTMTKHLCINRLRLRQRHFEEIGENMPASEHGSPHAQLEAKDGVDRVMRIIDRLPGLQQTVLRMKHVEGFEIAEIAELTGSTAEAVRVNLSRARKRVKELFLQNERG